MTEHYQRNVLEVTAWCNTCKRFTQHRVDDRRKGPCLEDHHAGKKPKKEKQKDQTLKLPL